MDCSNIKDGFIHINKIDNLKHKYSGNFIEDRKYLREKLIQLFKNESAGRGTGKLSTRVVYCVEKVKDITVYLKRPAPLNKGFDFEVHTSEKLFFGRVKTRPSHNCLFKVLRDLKNQDLNIFNQTQILIDEIYQCNEYNINSLSYEIDNISIELLLKVVKWLFVEQDITYWSYSGREMLYRGLKSV